MKITIFKCDGCGVEIDSPLHIMLTTEAGTAVGPASFDLCPHCADRVLNVMADAITSAPEPKKRVAPNKETKKYDVGKIYALADAGWSTRKIADEMGCVPQTISNYLKEREDKKDGDNTDLQQS